MTIEDIDEACGITDPSSENSSYGIMGEFTSGSYYYTYEENGKTVTSSTPKVASSTSPVTVKCTWYAYNPGNYNHAENSSITVGSLLGSSQGWLASEVSNTQLVNYEDRCYYMVRTINYNACGAYRLVNSYPVISGTLIVATGSEMSWDMGVRPLVSLKSSLQVVGGSGTQSSPWQLSK